MNGRIVFALLGFLVLFFISFPLLNMLMSTEPSLLYKTFTDLSFLSIPQFEIKSYYSTFQKI